MEFENQAMGTAPPKQKKPAADAAGFSIVKNPGETYFRTFKHYHRLGKLNFCVRYGNRCDLSDIVTRKGLVKRSNFTSQVVVVNGIFMRRIQRAIFVRPLQDLDYYRGSSF